MKKLFSLLAVALFVVAGLSPASACDEKTREETQEYGLPLLIGFDTDYGMFVASVEFEPGRAKTAEFTVEDTAAPATAFTVRQGDSNLGTFCTSTSGPIEIVPRKTLRVHLYAGVCDGGPSFITTGLVRARFSG